MQVDNSVSGVSSASNTKQSSINADFDMFLQMLTTQLQNQDPLSPMDGTDFTAQIAQFSQLEQQITSNDRLEALINQNTYSLQNLAVSYIGKEALAKGEQVALKDGKPVDFAYYLEQGATTSVVEIKNGEGEIVRSMEVDSKAGFHTVAWDGLDDNGDVLENGEYTLTLNAVGAEDKSSRKELYTYSRVTAVAADAGNALLTMVDGREILFSDIQEVRESSL